MPTIIRGHTHAPSVLIGEKAADLIRAGVRRRSRWAAPAPHAWPGPALGAGRQRLAPRRDAVDLDLDGEAEHRPDEHDHPEDGGVGQRRLRCDGLDDVRGHEQLQTEQDGAADRISKRLEGARPVGSLPRDGGQPDGIPGSDHHRRNAQYFERLSGPLEEHFQVHRKITCLRRPDLCRTLLPPGAEWSAMTMNAKRRRAHDKLAALPGVRAVRRPVAPDGYDEFDLYYVRTGRKSMNPLVIIPGGPGAASVALYRGLRRHAAARGLDVIMIDHRGVGMSRHDDGGDDLPPEALTIEQAVDDIAAVLDDAQVDKAVIYGTSYGTYLAAGVGVRHPDRVHAMVLDSPVLSAHDIDAVRNATRRVLWDGDDPEAAELAPKVRQLVEEGVLTSAKPGSSPRRCTASPDRPCWPVNSIYCCVADEDCGPCSIKHRGFLFERKAPYRHEPDLVGRIGFRELNYGAVPDGKPLDPAVAYPRIGKRAIGVRGRALRSRHGDAEVHLADGRHIRWPRSHHAAGGRRGNRVTDSRIGTRRVWRQRATVRSMSASERRWTSSQRCTTARPAACLPARRSWTRVPASLGVRLLVGALGAAAARSNPCCPLRFHAWCSG